MEFDRTIDVDFVHESAKDLSENSEFYYEDLVIALCRSVRYFLDIGENEEQANEHGLNLVARAMEAAPRYGFEVISMAEHMIFALFHKVPRNKQFIM